jgi:hypothetical protein
MFLFNAMLLGGRSAPVASHNQYLPVLHKN